MDILIVGGGIAGAGLGAALLARAPATRLAIAESEDQCGYHSTGRSAAFWLESYGGPAVQPLTRASHDALSRGGYLRQRGALHLRQSGHAAADLPAAVAVEPVGRAALDALLPGLSPDWPDALYEPGCADIDVAALHADRLRAVRAAGGDIRTSARLVEATHDGQRWTARFADGQSLTATVLVNAAGAWADPVARACAVAPIGITPRRRTMVQLRMGQGGLRDLPLVTDASGRFYFKGEGDRTLWLSPHDEIDSDPCDCAPEEIDVATAIARLTALVDWPVEAVERKWAGLRSFAPDRIPVYGFDPRSPGFFWCVGQGGFGIQTAPAASDLAAALLLGQPPALDPAPFDPARFA